MVPKILVGVPTAEYARKADFYDYFHIMVQETAKSVSTTTALCHGQSPARNRNQIIRQAIDGEFSHLFFLDDDVAFKSDIILKLLYHRVDIVSGLYLMRNYPHSPIMFDYTEPDGRCLHSYLYPTKSGLVPIVASGLGCLLVDVEVFKAMEEECKTNTWIRLGELEKDHWCDDIGFFQRVRKLNKFKMFCDTDVRVGHTAAMTIWPNYVDGQWFTVYDTNGPGSASVPQYYPTVDQLSELNLVGAK